jgi:hypothetical protein
MSRLAGLLPLDQVFELTLILFFSFVGQTAPQTGEPVPHSGIPNIVSRLAGLLPLDQVFELTLNLFFSFVGQTGFEPATPTSRT